MAKLFGVRVEAFSFGFGPRLFGFKYGDTDYKVCLLPLGGFVKMAGENPTEESADEIAGDPGAFTAKPRWQRMLIGLAGPVVNFILALVLMFVYYALFNEVPSVTVKSTVVEWSKTVPVGASGSTTIADHLSEVLEFRQLDQSQQPEALEFRQ